MDYTQYTDKTQVFNAFSSVDACQKAVSVKDNALLLFDFVQFCRIADPLFTAVWGADWMQTGDAYIYGTSFRSGDKRPINPHTHSFSGWQQGRGLTAAAAVDSLIKGDNWYLSKDGQRPRAKHIAMLTDRLAVIDIDCHNPADPDQREDLLNGLNYLKIAAVAEPTTAGLHVFFPATQGLTRHIMGRCQALDNAGRPLRLEIIACSYNASAGKYMSPHAVMLGCGRVEGYAMTAQQLTARLCVPGMSFSPIPSCLIPEKDETETMQPAAAPAYAQPTQQAYSVPAAVPPTPPAAPASAPSLSVFPPVSPAQAGVCQPASSPIPPTLPAAIYQQGGRNNQLFKRLTDVAKDIIYGDNALAILQAVAAAEYAAIPDKSTFPRSEVDGIVQSVYKQMAKDASHAADRRQQAELKKLCRMPKDAVKWACETLDIKPVRYNEMTRQIEGQKPIDAIVTDIYNQCQRQLTRPEIEAELLYTSDQTTYHPVREWLEGLPTADATPHELEKLCDLLDAGSLERAYIAHWLTQAVCCLYNGQDGTFFPVDCVLVLQGKQGAGKTSLLRHLAVSPDWWISGAKLDNDKDNAKRILTHWIAELGEIGSTMRKDQDSLKAFVSQERDLYRLPFARHDIQAPRQTALCGSVNEDEFLSDPTGARRWWVVRTPDKMERKDILSIDATKLWAYIYATALAERRRGREWADIYQLPDALKDAAAAQADRCRKKTAAEIDLCNLLITDIDDGCKINWKTASQLAADLPWSGTIRPNAQQVARALSAIGVTYKDIGGRKRIYGVAVTAETAREIEIRSGGAVRYDATED